MQLSRCKLVHAGMGLMLLSASTACVEEGLKFQVAQETLEMGNWAYNQGGTLKKSIAVVNLEAETDLAVTILGFGDETGSSALLESVSKTTTIRPNQSRTLEISLIRNPELWKTGDYRDLIRLQVGASVEAPSGGSCGQ